jgi:hypothetical protein
MAVDADTKKHLEDVKKGKPRRFVMICKGVKIVSLIVYKKGTVEKYKKQAKEEGKGQFYHGVVDGKGVNISFKLLRNDGFDKPPGKEIILKDFLKTEADIPFKPVYEIVDSLPDIPDDDDEIPLSQAGPIVQPAVEPEPASESPIPPAPPVAPASPVARESNPAELFKSRLAALIPQLKQAAGTPAGDQAKLKASEAGVFARKNDYARANTVLAEAEQLLKSSSADAGKEPPPPASNPADLFKSRLAALLPQLKQAAGTPAGDQAKLKASEAGVVARKLDFVQANLLLDQAEASLAKKTGSGQAAPAQEAPSQAAASTDVAGFSIVKLQESRLAWERLRLTTRSQLKELQAAILSGVRAHNADEESEEEYDEIEVVGGLQKLDSILEKLDERLLDKLDEALVSETDELRRARHAEAAKIISEYRALADSDPLLASIDANGFTNSTIGRAVSSTLAELASAC